MAFASDDWEAPAASNNLEIGGKFKITMAAKDKSTSFDFAGVYTTVKEHEMQRSGWQTIGEFQEIRRS
ncbi:MAG: SRPBCC domain-containing protein [Nitrososphaeraceae archaeon]|nr:SRPBCC domain-containing protein [Nitrososphaeraceae archaeon]